VTVQGQGHETVLSQIVADRLGLAPDDIEVSLALDTGKDPWSIAAGTYSCRFTPGTAVAAHFAATQMRDKLADIAAKQLNILPADIEFADGKIRSRSNPDNALPFGRIAATSHWSPGTVPDADQALRETVFWTPPELTAPTDADEVNSSLCHGFIFDFCGVEIDRVTGAVHVDKYVTMHDCGRILHPGMVAGQVRGGFAQGLGAALYEEYAYAQDGSFLAGTFADYLVPTTMEVPGPVILHVESPSPFTPLGAKGVGEGNCMSTPVCLANAVADALGLAEIDLPLTPAKFAAHIHPRERTPPARAAESVKPRNERALYGSGEADVAAAPEQIWQALLDPQALAAIIPGAHGVHRIFDSEFHADVTLGVGPVKGRYRAIIKLSELDPPRAVTLNGRVAGLLGSANGTGHIRLRAADETTRTVLSYDYEVEIGGKVASVGSRLLDGAARFVIRQFFEALSRQLGGEERRRGWFARLAALFGRRG